MTGEDGTSDAHDDEAACLLLGHASTTFGNDGTSVPSTTSTTPTSDHFVDQYARYNVVRCNEFANAWPKYYPAVNGSYGATIGKFSVRGSSRDDPRPLVYKCGVTPECHYAQPSPMPLSSGDHLSSGTIAGIVVGVVAVVIGSLVALWFLWWRKRDTKAIATAEEVQTKEQPPPAYDVDAKMVPQEVEATLVSPIELYDTQVMLELPAQKSETAFEMPDHREQESCSGQTSAERKPAESRRSTIQRVRVSTIHS